MSAPDLYAPEAGTGAQSCVSTCEWQPRVPVSEQPTRRAQGAPQRRVGPATSSLSLCPRDAGHASYGGKVNIFHDYNQTKGKKQSKNYEY